MATEKLGLIKIVNLFFLYFIMSLSIQPTLGKGEFTWEMFANILCRCK